MATITLGTTAQTSLTALAFITRSSADIASIANAIKDDLSNGHPIVPGAYSRSGMLFVPNRGVLRVLDGDYVGVDSQGFPILVSANSIANAAWTHS